MTNTTFFKRGLLQGGTAVAALAILGAGFATPAFAQDATNQPGTQSSDPQTTSGGPTPGSDDQGAVTNANEGSENEEIVVTGSLFRRTNAETPSPVTVMSAESLAQRGLNTVAEAVQRVSAGNAGTITQGWNTGFNFASGANAVSLRGLTVQSTLTIFDGLRMAPYPLADDGQRNFVDLNTIPNAVIDRIEVLRDGASSTYGSDAVAGVINVIMKKEIQGLHLNASGGISQRGDAGEQRVDLTWGYGDLDEQGFNFYISGEYQRQDELWARDRDYPFNTQDLSQICNEDGSSCMHNLNLNGYSPEDGFYNGLFATPGVALVRMGSLTTPTNGTGQYQFLNPAAGCRQFEAYTTPSDVFATAPAAPAVTCEIDHQYHYQMLQPEIERKGLSARFTFNIGDRHQLYAMGNYYETDTHTTILPINMHGTPTPPNPAGLAQYNVLLPVYVCPTGVGTPTGTGTGCDATNGVLNPQNPYAAQGRTAHVIMRLPFERDLDTSSRALRGVIGVSGSFGDDWNYAVDFTASNVTLDRSQKGYIIPQNVADANARGEINYFDPSLTPQSVWDFVAPPSDVRSTSDLWQVTGTLTKALFELPGGPLQAAVGAAYRSESIDAPSANPANLSAPYTRYVGINSVGTSGSRTVKSAFGELSAPILDQLEVQLSGRYDEYSTGQNNFSPKVGVKFTPIPQLALRATWTRGFRAPSFNESFGLPTTGYVTQQIQCEDYPDFCAQHGGEDSGYASGQFPVGLTSSGNPDLAPEKSTTITAGFIFEPIRNVSFTVDFWRIKVTDLIVGVTNIGPFIEEYYSNNGVVNAPGIVVTPGIPNALFPNATPHIGFIESSYANADNQLVEGIDFGVNARFDLTEGVRLTSSFEASYLHKNRLTPRDLVTGELQEELRYEDSLSPCNVTSCSGSPQWRGSWQNTLEFGDTTLSATAYYTKGLDVAAADYGATYGDCDSAVSAGSAHTYANGEPVQCRSPDVWNVDFTASHRIDDRFTIYANVLNVLDIEAPFDPNSAYGLLSFSPAWAGPNIIGRYVRIGAKVDF